MGPFQLLKTLVLIIVVVTISNSENVNKELFSKKPTEKEIISAVFSLNTKRLRDCQDCTNAGTELSDSTVGQYLAGFLSYITDSSGVNYFDIQCTSLELKKSDSVSTKDKKVWSIDFKICRKKFSKNEVWCWGLRFQMDSTFHVISSSVMCIGAG